MLDKKPTFESLISTIEAQIEKRRGSWRLASLPWEDASQMILTRAFIKYHTFDPKKGEFSHWLSRLITNERINILRNNHLKWSRPCIQGCIHNTGGDSCDRTKSGKQCAECPFYKKWIDRKESHYAIEQTLPLENHVQEVNSIQSDFIDIEGAKGVIDLKMKEKLNKHEYMIYKLLYVDGKSEKEVGKLMGYKKTNSRMHAGYQNILKTRKKVLEMAKEIIAEENLA